MRKDFRKYYDHVHGRSAVGALSRAWDRRYWLLSLLALLGVVIMFSTGDDSDKKVSEQDVAVVEEGEQSETDENLVEETLEFTRSTLETYLGYTQPTISIAQISFIAQNKIPLSSSCYREGYSPAISWDDAGGEDVFVPAKSYVLTMENIKNPDEPVLYWMSYNIPVDSTAMKEGLATNPESFIRQATNDFGVSGYSPPCHPVGKDIYRIRVFALDTFLAPQPGLSGQEILSAMGNNVVEWGEIEVAHYFRL